MYPRDEMSQPCFYKSWKKTHIYTEIHMDFAFHKAWQIFPTTQGTFIRLSCYGVLFFVSVIISYGFASLQTQNVTNT